MKSFIDFGNSLVAGSLAGVSADVLTHPISTLKTRMQVQGAGRAMVNTGGTEIARYSSLSDAARRVIRNEGVMTLYKGIGITVAAAAPAQGLYFAGYDAFRSLCGQNNPLSNFLAGAFAQLCGSLIWVPMDTIKERLQIEGQLTKVSEPLGTSSRAIKLIISREGIAGLYPAYWIHQLTWMPFNGLYFAIFEWSMRWTQEHDYPTWPSGVLAGVIAGTLTNPMDVIKTRIQVIRSSPDLFRYHGTLDCLLSMVRTEGLISFFDGAFARCLLLTPRLTMAIAMKQALQRNFFFDASTARA